jgi:hypothetical protein
VAPPGRRQRAAPGRCAQLRVSVKRALA